MDERRLTDVERVKFWRWFINNNIQVTHSQDIIDQYYKESGVEVSTHAVNDINRKMRFIDWYNREYRK